MHFVTEQARRYNTSPIMTFDQPLHWKGIEIQQSQDDASPLKEILLPLGGVHTSMSFLGSIGHLMTSSGLKTMLESVYAENTVPHMLSHFANSAWSSLSARSKFWGRGWQGRRTSQVPPSLPPPLIFKAKFKFFVTLPS